MSLFATLSINDIQHNAFSVIMLCVVITLMLWLSIIMPNVTMMIVIMPSVVTP